MYEYNFNDIRKTIEEILDKSLTKSKEAYYNQLEIFKNDQDDNESLKDVKVKKKKIIMKDPSNGQANIEKEVIDFEDVENLKMCIRDRYNVYEDKIETYSLVNIIHGYEREELNHANYILDTVYRTVSFSKSSYLPRSYNQFINEDMGQKK